QGGTDSLADTGKVKEVTYGDVHGANPEAKLVINGGASSGLSGTPQADLGNVTPQYESRDNRK
ncbi:MAG TPA: hypothetical protein VD902_06065, partial [Symbiobacteriaceae bacterium]|nr:hypothetical protein [Symbiobacteriaceae bacterium]